MHCDKQYITMAIIIGIIHPQFVSSDEFEEDVELYAAAGRDDGRDEYEEDEEDEEHDESDKSINWDKIKDVFD